MTNVRKEGLRGARGSVRPGHIPAAEAFERHRVGLDEFHARAITDLTVGWLDHTPRDDALEFDFALLIGERKTNRLFGPKPKRSSDLCANARNIDESAVLAVDDDVDAG